MMRREGPTIKKGDLVRRDKDNLQGCLEYGIDAETSKECPIIGFISAKDGCSYLVSVRGKLLDGWEVINE